jgi:hypothetical protein
MNFSVAAVMVAAVAACNGRDPRAAPATARPIATHGAAPVVMPPPPAAVSDAHPAGAGGLETAAASTADDDDLPGPRRVRGRARAVAGLVARRRRRQAPRRLVCSAGCHVER